MEQKNSNAKKLKRPDATLSGIYHAAGFLLMWGILRTGLIGWLLTPFWEIVDTYPGANLIPFPYLFLIALSIIPGILGGYGIAKFRQETDIRSFTVSYATNFIYVFAIMTSPLIFYYIFFWQSFDLYYYPEFYTWIFNFGWCFLFGGLLIFFVTRQWEIKLPRQQAMLLGAITFGLIGLLTNGFYALFAEFYYWVSALRLLAIGFVGGIGIGSALNSDPEESIHNHYYQ